MSKNSRRRVFVDRRLCIVTRQVRSTIFSVSRYLVKENKFGLIQEMMSSFLKCLLGPRLIKIYRSQGKSVIFISIKVYSECAYILNYFTFRLSIMFQPRQKN